MSKKLIHSAHSRHSAELSRSPGSGQASSGLRLRGSDSRRLMLSKATHRLVHGKTEALKIGIVVDQLLAGGVQLAAIEFLDHSTEK